MSIKNAYPSHPPSLHPSNPALKGRSVLILGGGLMQIPLIQKALKHEMNVYVMDQNKNALGVKLISKDRFIHASIGDSQSAPQTLHKYLAHKHREVSTPHTKYSTPLIETALTVGTDFTPTVAKVNETLAAYYPHHKFPSQPLSYTDALAASHKLRMRERFQAHGIRQPKFLGWDDSQNLPLATLHSQLATTQLNYPLVLKPADAMGSRGVKRIDNPNTLKATLHESLAFSPTRTLILEAYIPGVELSVDAIIAQGEIFIRGTAERIIEHPPYFVEMGHFMPPKNVSAPELALAHAEFGKAIRALNIVNGAAKGDIRIYQGNVYMGEVAARLSGGFMSAWTTPLHLGVDMMQALLEVSLGIPPTTLTPTSETTQQRPVVCEWALLAPPGRLKAIKGLETARTLHGINQIFVHAHIGDIIAPPKNNLMKASNIITTAPTFKENQEIFLQAQQTLKFITA